MTQMIHPDSLEPSRAIGAWISHPDGHDTPLGNSSWILLRASSGEYEHVRVWDPDEPVPNEGSQGLRVTRTVESSPFEADRGRVWFVGGFDSGLSTTDQEFSDTAWTYRAELP